MFPAWPGARVDLVAQDLLARAVVAVLLYATDGRVATITINRPQQLNTIVPPMPDDIAAAVERAIRDAAVKVIVLCGPDARSALAMTSRRLRGLGTA